MNERQRGAAAFGLAVIGAVVAPVVRNFQRNPVDSFPLSHYPMFSAAHPELLDVTHLIGVTASGKRVPLRCSLLGPGGMNQLRTQIRRAATGPRPERTTDRIARRVANDAAYADVVCVHLVTSGYRVGDWFGGQFTPVTELVHATSHVQPVER